MNSGGRRDHNDGRAGRRVRVWTGKGQDSMKGSRSGV